MGTHDDKMLQQFGRQQEDEGAQGGVASVKKEDEEILS